MMKWMKSIACLLAAACLLSGCTKSNIISEATQDYSDLPQPGPDGIVWEQLWEDWDEIYTDLNDFPYAETVSGGVYPEENALKFYILLNTTISREEAAQYATTVIKGFNDLISEQNPEYEPSSDESYGGYASQYEIYVMVAPDGTKADTSTWILEDTIPAGEYRAVSPEAVPTREAAETEAAE